MTTPNPEDTEAQELLAGMAQEGSQESTGATETDEQASEAPDHQGEPEDGSESQETFPREYVEDLRKEAAGYRVKAKRADDLATRLVHALAAQTGRMADPTDLPMSDDLLNEDGMPDADKIGESIDALLKSKPHLASRKVSGDVGQGVQGATEDTPSLAAIVRQAAM